MAFQRAADQAAEAIQSTIADGISSALDGEINSAKDFFDSFVDIGKRAFSELAAAAILHPETFVNALNGGATAPDGTVAPIGAFSLATGTGGTLADLAPGLFGGADGGYSGIPASGGGALSSLGGVSTGSAVLGAVGAGVAGYSIGQSTGSPAIGALGGAAGGALLGFTLGNVPGAIIGGGIGALAGLAGGLFAPNGGTHNDNYTAGYNLSTGRAIDFQNTKPSQENASAVTAIINDLSTLRAGLTDLGATVKGTALTIQQGNKSGATLNGVKYGSAQELDKAALAQLLAGTTGLSANQNLAIKNSAAKDGAGLLSDIQFAKSLDELIRGPLSTFDTALKSLDDTFGKATTRAKDLGLSTAALSAERIKEVRELRANSNFEIDLLTGAKTQTDAAIRDIQKTYTTAITEAKALGRTEATLTDLRRAEADAIALVKSQQKDDLAGLRGQAASLSSQAASRITGTFGPGIQALQEFKNSTSFGSLSNLSPQQQLAAARAEFSKQARLGATDPTAAQGLPGLAQQVLQLGQIVNANGPDQQALFREVNSRISQDMASLQKTQDQFLKSVPGAIKEASQGVVDALREELGEVRSQLRELNARIKRAG